MKRSTLALVAIAAVAATSCKISEIDAVAPETDGTVYTLEATVGDGMATRSYFSDDDPSYYIRWESDDEFDFQDITIREAESVAVSSAKPGSIKGDGMYATFTATAHDYMVITYPKGAVTLSGTMPQYYNSTAKDTVRYNSAAAVYAHVEVPCEQKLTGTLSPENVPMASVKLALSDAAKAKVSAKTDTVAVAYDGTSPVVMYPLAGLAKVTIKGLPGVTAAKITRVTVSTDYAAVDGEKITSTGCSQYGIVGENWFLPTSSMEVARPYVSGETNRKILTLSDGTVDYTAEGGAVVCFTANTSKHPVKTMVMQVWTEDGASFSKSFDMSENNVYFSKSRISSFSLDFSTGATAKDSDTRFKVEWSKGYLTYDAEGKAFKFAEPDEVGLYFKFGSAAGFQFYADTRDYDSRIKPGGTGSEDGQTIANGTDYWCYSYTGLGTWEWKSKTYYAPDSNGDIVAGAAAAVADYRAIQGSKSFTAATDPCSYVKVGEGENRWRVPTEAEILDLTSVGAAGVIYGNLDGSSINGTDGKSRYFKVSDGAQTLTFKAIGSMPESATSAQWYMSFTYSNKYAIRFWSTTFSEKVSSGLQANKAKYLNFSLSSTPSVTTKMPTSLTEVNAGVVNKYQDTATNPLWEAAPVRCVRDKK